MAYNLATEIAITVFMIAAFSVASLQPYFSHQTLAAAQSVMNPAINMTQQCSGLGQMLGGISVPSGSVCDVVVVRKTPEIIGHNGLVMNKFTLMNSVIEFMASNTSSSNQSVYVM